MPSARGTASVMTLVLMLLAGCGDDGDGSAPDPADAPPTTYLITRTGRWSGSVGAVGDPVGTITFTVSETADSTHLTLADGQVVVYDFVVEDLEVVLRLSADACPSGEATGEVRVSIPDAIPLDADARFSAQTAEMSIEGSTIRTASGTVTVVLDGAGCEYGPVVWVAEAL